MKSCGETVKEIRSGKGYSQKYISERVCTQGNYSKFEIENSREIKFSLLNNFLDKLEVSFDEFLFIQNDYKLPLKQEILSTFFYQTYNSPESLIKLKKKCISYLIEKPNDRLIIKINMILDGMLVLAKSNNFSEAQKVLVPIWEELSKHNTLYLVDIYLLNSILFIFPLETAMEIKNFAFRSIDKYNGFQNINKLKTGFLINCSLLNLKNNKFNTALVLLEESIHLCKIEKQFINLSVCYVRKGVCLINLNEAGDYYINKGLKILKVLDEFDLIGVLEGEIQKFKKEVI